MNHEARTYAQENFDQYDRWHGGAPSASVSPAWEVAFRAMRQQSVTAIGDLMLALNAHIRRDNPIRAVEQTEGVLRVPGADARRIGEARSRTRERRAPQRDVHHADAAGTAI